MRLRPSRSSAIARDPQISSMSASSANVSDLGRSACGRRSRRIARSAHSARAACRRRRIRASRRRAASASIVPWKRRRKEEGSARHLGKPRLKSRARRSRLARQCVSRSAEGCRNRGDKRTKCPRASKFSCVRPSCQWTALRSNRRGDRLRGRAISASCMVLGVGVRLQRSPN